MDNHPRGIVIESTDFLISAIGEIVSSKMKRTTYEVVGSKAIWYSLYEYRTKGPALFSASLVSPEVDGQPQVIRLERHTLSAVHVASIAHELTETYHVNQLIMLV